MEWFCSVNPSEFPNTHINVNKLGAEVWGAYDKNGFRYPKLLPDSMEI